MKRISRTLVISACALFFTSFWNKGFLLPDDFRTLILAIFLLAVVFYIILPISKVILLPLNIITLGLVSFLVYIALLHFGSISFHIFEVTPWTFAGIHISYFANLVLSSISLSSIINLLELLV